MSRFKDAVRKDIKATFLNLDEYGEWHNLNGKIVQCDIDKNLTQGTDKGDIIGVFANLQAVYVSADDIPVPVEGELFHIDGSLHLVKSVSEEGGMLVIVAEASEQ